MEPGGVSPPVPHGACGRPDRDGLRLASPPQLWGLDWRRTKKQAPFFTIMEDRRMSDSRSKGRRSPTRAFRPALDSRLEDRVVLSRLSLHQYLSLSQALLKTPNPRAAYASKFPPLLGPGAPQLHPKPTIRKINAAATQTIRG